MEKGMEEKNGGRRIEETIDERWGVGKEEMEENGGMDME